MAITAADVKKLRDATGAGMMDCKKALTEADGDFDKAVEILRVTGQAKAAKRGAERSATNGLVAFADGALLQLGAETDFVAKNDEFQALADDVVKRRSQQPGPAMPSSANAAHAAVRPDRRRGRRRPRRQDRREARGRQRRVLRRRDSGLPAQARLRPAAAGGRAGRVRGRRRGPRPRTARCRSPRCAAVPEPRRRPGRPGGERAPDRRGHGQGRGQARAGRRRGSSRAG